MKKSDITIGAEYAYSNYDHGARQRVRVIGEVKVQQGWGYRAKMITGSKILFLDAAGQPMMQPGSSDAEWTANVANREIREPWLQYAEREAALRRARQEAKRTQHDQREERAKLLPGLIAALRAAGVEDTVGRKIWATDRDVLPYLERHIPEALGIDGEGILAQHTVTAPLADGLVDFVRSGVRIPVPADVLLMLAQQR